MDKTEHIGCWQIVASVALLLWLGLVPPGVMFAAHSALSKTAGPGVIATVAIVATAVLLLPPFIAVLLSTRRRAGWKATAAVASGLVLVWPATSC